MSTELWAIIGVVIGALATGGMSLLQTILQRRSSRAEAERAWERQAQDRLFEAKRTAHAAFMDEVHIVADQVHQMRLSRQRGDVSSDDAEWGEAGRGLIRLQSQVQVYGSPESARAAKEAVVAVNAMIHSEAPQRAREQIEVFFRAMRVYLILMRVDLGIDTDKVVTDDLMLELRSVGAMAYEDLRQGVEGSRKDSPRRA
ncbi:hypothetical protein [Nocardioides albus]|uniref:Uncharacterized protein n=1 Tax=Nocardioides albus TaxID=1841 RepID=A0A7W5F860_9ACTN|nr:hypothetical protein [Nocardioides albus]MBB3088557.1 hypothetical protein [Nocardioides albus]GGU17125.1 hypothetical protein GCM10007979_14480 [Nocardioides albus]